MNLRHLYYGPRGVTVFLGRYVLRVTWRHGRGVAFYNWRKHARETIA